MGKRDTTDRRELDRYRVRPRIVLRGSLEPKARTPLPPRLEIRVCRVGEQWEVRPGVYGPTTRHARLSVAQAIAHELARRAWIDDGLLSSVKRLNDEGTWEVDDVFGVAPG